MAIDLRRFAQLRPFLYHLTAATNIARILRRRRLETAESLMRVGGRTDLIRTRRLEDCPRVLRIGEDNVSLRDQCPLYEGNIDLADGWTLGDVVSLLNRRVFFWPGDGEGAIRPGTRHYDRYSDEKPSILRIATVTLLEMNAEIGPEFCRYNSGSPRCVRAVRSPRGPQTFVTAARADFPPGQVVEVTFPEGVRLPDLVEIGPTPTGPWESR